MAYAATQHHGAFAAAQAATSGANAPRTSPNFGGGPAAPSSADAKRVAAPAAPRTSPNFGAAPAAPEEFDPHAETDPPAAADAAQNATSELRDSDLLESREAARGLASELESARYLPGDPMAPQAAQPTAAAQRAPMLRYDDSIPKVSRSSGMDEKKWVMIAGGVIVFLCLILVIVLASKMSH